VDTRPELGAPLKIHHLHSQGVEVDDTHLVQIRELAGTLAGIEFELVGKEFDGFDMRMPKQCQVVFVIQILIMIVCKIVMVIGVVMHILINALFVLVEIQVLM